jgi:RNA-binding protein Musashi
MFVGGLAPSVTNESMREYFSQFGKVIDSTVMVDRDSSRSKGFGFVTFDDQSGAERLLGMPGLQIDGKNVSRIPNHLLTKIDWLIDRSQDGSTSCRNGS